MVTMSGTMPWRANPQNAESRLHLIGDVNAAFAMHQVNDRFQETTHAGDDAVGGEDAVEEHAGELDAVTAHVGDLHRDLIAHPRPQILGAQAERVGRGDHAHGAAHGDGFADGRRQPGYQRRVAVVRLAGHDDALAAGVELRAAYSQVVGLGARAHEHDAVELVRHGGQQILRVIQDVLMHVARVGVQQLHLARDGLGDRRVAVAHGRDVVVHVQILGAVGVEQTRAAAAHQMQRVLVEQAVARPEHLATRDQVVQFAVQGVQVVHVEAVRFKDAAILRSAHGLPRFVREMVDGRFVGNVRGARAREGAGTMPPDAGHAGREGGASAYTRNARGAGSGAAAAGGRETLQSQPPRRLLAQFRLGRLQRRELFLRRVSDLRRPRRSRRWPRATARTRCWSKRCRRAS